MLTYDSIIDTEQDMSEAYRVRVYLKEQNTNQKTVHMFKFDHNPTEAEVKAVAEKFMIHDDPQGPQQTLHKLSQQIPALR